MEIKKLNNYNAQAPQRAQEQNQTRVSGDEKLPSGQDGSVEADRVVLSRGYQEMAQVKKVVMERGDLRTERVDHLRNLIANNQYVVDPDKVAKKMLEEMW